MIRGFDYNEIYDRYEMLRSEALNASGMHCRGLALFSRQGMSGWMEAWTGCRQVVPEAPVIQYLPTGKSSQLTVLLANMILEAEGYL